VKNDIEYVKSSLLHLPLLRVSSLVKKYARKEVLRVEDFSFFGGKIYSIIGPSGAGKSTFLRLLNLLDFPTEGKIFFQGREVPPGGKERLKIQRQMTMVFQKPVLFNTTVYNNVAYGLSIRGESGKCKRKKALSALERVGMKDFAGRRAASLSGGEGQRVALARAIVLEPEILFMDEPTANLDPANIALVEKVIKELNRERGTTVIMVTHNIFQARRLAQEVLFIYKGRLLESGPAESFFARPRNKRTAAFIRGDMIW